jgi:hypothetical protein
MKRPLFFYGFFPLGQFSKAPENIGVGSGKLAPLIFGLKKIHLL